MTWLYAWRIGRLLPASVLNWLADILIPRLIRSGKIDTTALRINLVSVLGPKSEDELHTLIAQNVRSYARYWCELFKLSGQSRADLLRRVVVHDAQILRAAAAEGRGVILALPHMGNWDVAGAWAAQFYSVTTVAEQVSPPQLFQEFMDVRTHAGLKVLQLGDGLSTLNQLREALAAGGVVALVADRCVQGSAGVQVDFGGQTALLPVGPTTLAYQCAAPLVPVSLHYEGRRMHLRFLPPVAVDQTAPRRTEVARATQALADAFLTMIRANPQDWRALQPVALDDAHHPADVATSSADEVQQ